ncbi:MAG: hypothetical protein LC122_05330 [Chitinophagales bacterium]|nr:hypothetical protein [Chitinophagales bacterium]
MLNIIAIILCYIGVYATYYLSKKERTTERLIELHYVYSLVFQVGIIGFVFGFIPHVIFSEFAANKIGWNTSPFQIEVGIHDGAWGLLGFLCIKYKNGFRAATAIGWALFMLGAAIGHVVDFVKADNAAEYNYLMIFVDFFVAFNLPTLVYLDYKSKKKLKDSA